MYQWIFANTIRWQHRQICWYISWQAACRYIGQALAIIVETDICVRYLKHNSVFRLLITILKN